MNRPRTDLEVWLNLLDSKQVEQDFSKALGPRMATRGKKCNGSSREYARADIGHS